MNTKTETIQTPKTITKTAIAVVLMAGLISQQAYATDPTPAIQAQGQAAIAAIQSDLRAGLPGAGRETAQQRRGAESAVREAISIQRDHALRAIAWENEAFLHVSTRGAAADARPTRGGYVTVTAPMHYGAQEGDGI